MMGRVNHDEECMKLCSHDSHVWRRAIGCLNAWGRAFWLDVTLQSALRIYTYTLVKARFSFFVQSF